MQDATPAGEFPFWKVLAAGGAAGLAGSVISCPSEHVSAGLGSVHSAGQASVHD